MYRFDFTAQFHFLLSIVLMASTIFGMKTGIFLRRHTGVGVYASNSRFYIEYFINIWRAEQ